MVFLFSDVTKVVCSARIKVFILCSDGTKIAMK